MSDLVETRYYDEASDSLIIKSSYSNADVLAWNVMTKNLQPETGRYKGSLVHVAKIDVDDIQRLKNLGYNLLSPDPDEVKRALLYIQAEEKALMCMPGNPIGKRKQSWR